MAAIAIAFGSLSTTWGLKTLGMIFSSLNLSSGIIEAIA